MDAQYLPTNQGIRHERPKSHYEYCCGCFPIFGGIFLIVIHSFIHGIYGMSLVLSSYYRDRDDAVNYTTMVGFLFLILIGLPILWVAIFQRTLAIKCCSSVLIFLTMFNLATSIAYFVVYHAFDANTLLDRWFFWRRGGGWASEDDAPFLVWHVLAGLLIFLTPLWLYYSFVLFMFTKYLEYIDEQEPVTEIIVFSNRMGPFAYRPPEGYPYSTNDPNAPPRSGPPPPSTPPPPRSSPAAGARHPKDVLDS